MSLSTSKERRQIRRYIVSRNLQVEVIWSAHHGEIQLGGKNTDPRNGV